jgi:hypothetical protein
MLSLQDMLWESKKICWQRWLLTTPRMTRWKGISISGLWCANFVGDWLLPYSFCYIQSTILSNLVDWRTFSVVILWWQWKCANLNEKIYALYTCLNTCSNFMHLKVPLRVKHDFKIMCWIIDLNVSVKHVWHLMWTNNIFKLLIFTLVNFHMWQRRSMLHPSH